LQHTLEDRGHFRTVEPIVILEVAFNNIQKSSRHESGYALRFPRIVRIRKDKTVEDIDTLDSVAKLFARQGQLPAFATEPESTGSPTPSDRETK
jgi:DNA ligase 1